uniref:Uncharacterized protein n=1 Tax=Paenarthrobacter nicotinovorans TaxID=29320 RepID=Q8GAI1_PAENI|nr:hypothetical protein [Paenarthrobacter nicotinovorans]
MAKRLPRRFCVPSPGHAPLGRLQRKPPTTVTYQSRSLDLSTKTMVFSDKHRMEGARSGAYGQHTMQVQLAGVGLSIGTARTVPPRKGTPTYEPPP